MVIEPIRNKEGKVLTNVEIVRMCYDQLANLRDGVGCQTNKQRELNEDRFYRICGGSDKAEQLMKFMKQVVDEPDDEKAQKIIARGILPVEFK